MRSVKLLVLLSLACASGADAAPPATRPAPKPDTCAATGKVVFAIDHKVSPGAKLGTSSIKVYATGAWSRDDTDADGQAMAPTSGCLAKAEVKKLSDSLRGVPWKITTAKIRCMAISPQFTEYHVDGRAVYTQRLCSGQNLDDKSRAALDAATKQVELAAGPSKPTP
jgi:hypothetical protein